MGVSQAAWPARFLIIGHATTLCRYRLQAMSALTSPMGCCHGSARPGPPGPATAARGGARGNAARLGVPFRESGEF